LTRIATYDQIGSNQQEERAVIGKKEETQSLFHYFDPDDLIPDDYILRRIDRHIDFSFIG
jgi:hypothetical protein